MRHEIVLGGFGGQGIKVIGALLAQGVHRTGRQVALYTIYAAAIRGGPIFCTVIADEQPLLGAPTTTSPTAVLAMDPNTVGVYGPVLRPGGVLVVNTSLAAPPSKRTDVVVVGVPTSEIAEELGDIRYASMVALGALAEAAGVVSLEALHAVLEDLLPAHRRHMAAGNQEALRRGARCAREVTAPRC